MTGCSPAHIICLHIYTLARFPENIILRKDGNKNNEKD